MVSLYELPKEVFQEASTLVRGEVDLLGAVLFMHNIDDEVDHKSDVLSRAGMRSGVDSRFAFETSVRQNDTLVAEFVASQKHKGGLSDLSECPLSLAKVSYTANVSNWLSAIAIPVGAQCRDVAVLTNPSNQGKGLTDLSSFGPPLLNQHNGSAVGLMVKKSNIVASLAQFVSGLGAQVGSGRVELCLSTFGQIVCQLPGGTKLSLLGLHQMPRLSSEYVDHRVGALTIPLGSSTHDRSHETIVEGSLTHHRSPEAMVEAYMPPLGSNSPEKGSSGSIALMLESEVDEMTKIGGWIEMKQSNPRHLEWAVSVSDDSEDSVGWGMNLSGILGGPNLWDRVQIESYMKLNLGKRFSVKPGIAHIVDGNARMDCAYATGTELHGIDRTVLMRALKLLEQKGKLAIFKGTTADDEGRASWKEWLRPCLIEVNEIAVQVVMLLAFLFHQRLLQLKWYTQLHDQHLKASWVAEKKVFLAYSPLYIAGGFVVLFMNVKQNQLHIESALSWSFYLGITFMRVLPHAYDLYRAKSYDPWSSKFSIDPHASFHSGSPDVIVCSVCLLFAAIICLPQQFGGRCILPSRFGGHEDYEKVLGSSDK
ncbi:uncharacterized protein Pyn_07736 [Prunus yedoensis var. nudiflora]|uniref:RING-type E3 ubiquitin transferase n=1 Tax=Prunus yedoensis var. nudiflora TaxID=2094558 RepID=A0A314ZW39_PRUYE|nr:uncharacterized protein Pyn_07736 [Prunus yedoensis var. nudiflora]